MGRLLSKYKKGHSQNRPYFANIPMNQSRGPTTLVWPTGMPKTYI